LEFVGEELLQGRTAPTAVNQATRRQFRLQVIAQNLHDPVDRVLGDDRLDVGGNVFGHPRPRPPTFFTMGRFFLPTKLGFRSAGAFTTHCSKKKSGNLR